MSVNYSHVVHISLTCDTRFEIVDSSPETPMLFLLGCVADPDTSNTSTPPELDVVGLTVTDTAAPPGVLLIMLDDLGFGDTSISAFAQRSAVFCFQLCSSCSRSSSSSDFLPTSSGSAAYL